MTIAYEDLMEELENSDLSETAREAALDAMAFVLALHTTFKDNGVSLPETPDCSVLENTIDGVHGELAAACIFLSERSFARVPEMLRTISEKFDSMDQNFTDTQGVTGPSVPFVVRKGFERLAQRIEATRIQKSQMLNILGKTEV